MHTDFHVWPFRFRFCALDRVFFPPGKAGNVLRGAFGTIFQRTACVAECHDAKSCEKAAECPYALIFEPRQKWAHAAGPSGLADWPRPFVFRAMHLDGRRIEPGEPFHFDLILFDSPVRTLPYFVRTFRELVAAGLGAARGRAELTGVHELPREKTVFDGERMREMALSPLCFALDTAEPEPASRALVRFLTPTELKSGGDLATRPEFGVLFRRLRDRVSNLRSFYQGGPLAIDFEVLAARADRVQLIDCRLRYESAERLSSRTGQRHRLAGFVGDAVYEGDLSPFLPYLRAGIWTGVGRQTVWGKGSYDLVCPAPI